MTKPVVETTTSPGAPAPTSTDHTRDELIAALHALRPLARAADLDVAYLHLAGEPGAVLCRRCGRITRHRDTMQHLDGCRDRRALP